MMTNDKMLWQSSTCSCPFSDSNPVHWPNAIISSSNCQNAATLQSHRQSRVHYSSSTSSDISWPFQKSFPRFSQTFQVSWNPAAYNQQTTQHSYYWVSSQTCYLPGQSTLLERRQSSQRNIGILPGSQQRIEFPIRHNGGHPHTECTVYNKHHTGNAHKHVETARYREVISEDERDETEQQRDDVENLAWLHLLNSAVDDRQQVTQWLLQLASITLLANCCNQS